MKCAYLGCVIQFLTTTFLLSQQNPVPAINQTARVASLSSASQADPKAQARILDSYGKLPLSFEANYGQTDVRVKFLSRTSEYTLFLTGDEAVLALSGKKASTDKAKVAGVAHNLHSDPAAPKAGGVLRMRLHNANPAAKVTGLDELAGTSNYFIGNDPTKWRTNVPTYAKVKYKGIYSGIDLVYYGNQRQLEYDFVVAPGADPHRITFDVLGAKRIRRDKHGDLAFKMSEDEVRWHKPVVYQEKDGTRQEIAGRYAIRDKNRVGFEVAKYDASKPLYIDPLIYSTYLGGSGTDYDYGIAVDSAGNAYVTGSTQSSDFPTMNPLQPAIAGGQNAFVSKLNPSGSALVYSTYLGGSGGDLGYGIAVDSAGNAYVTGVTESGDFPTMNPLQPANAGNADAFVSEINSAGSALVYSTYLGGSALDIGFGIAVDSAGNAYITGETCSINFPTVHPLQGYNAGGAGSQCGDVFVTEINAAGSALTYSTYLGGSLSDHGNGIAVDSAGNAYVTGSTQSIDFPSVNPFQGAITSEQNAFVSKLNPLGSALVYSSYLGGSGSNFGYGIAVDSAGNAYVTGWTCSTNFPVTPGAFQTTYAGAICGSVGGANAFVTKVNPSGSALVYSTYLGGSGGDQGFHIALDSADNAYITGSTASTNFPTMNPLQPTYGGGGDAFVTELNPSGSALVYSTYLGGSGEDYGWGIAVDSAGNAYVTGSTQSSNFPTMNPLQPANGGGYDAFVAKIQGAIATTTTTLISSVDPSISGKPVTFTATVSSPSGGAPTGKVTFREGATVLATKTLSGGMVSFTTSKLPLGSNSITAVYGGDPNFTGSTSAPLNQFVLAATTTALSSSPNASTYGQAVTFTATVTSSIGAPRDGETVTFKKGTTVLGTGTLSGGSANFTTSTLKVGTTAVTAMYGGDSNFGGSTSKAVSQVVSKATTTTTLFSSLNPSNIGQSVTFTVNVTPQFSGTPTGSVVFKDGTTALKTVSLSGGVAKVTTSKLASGTHSITTTYNGSTSFIGSSASLTQTVN
jgi:Big-like domain-containing protein/beta-propeller repeat-containing protein